MNIRKIVVGGLTVVAVYLSYIAFNPSKLITTGRSMYPLWNGFTEITIDTAPIAVRDLKPGMLIAFKNQHREDPKHGRWITHRFIGLTADGIPVIKGDNNDYIDATYTHNEGDSFNYIPTKFYQIIEAVDLFPIPLLKYRYKVIAK